MGYTKSGKKLGKRKVIRLRSMMDFGLVEVHVQSKEEKATN